MIGLGEQQEHRTAEEWPSETWHKVGGVTESDEHKHWTRLEPSCHSCLCAIEVPTTSPNPSAFWTRVSDFKLHPFPLAPRESDRRVSIDG